MLQELCAKYLSSETFKDFKNAHFPQQDRKQKHLKICTQTNKEIKWKVVGKSRKVLIQRDWKLLLACGT